MVFQFLPYENVYGNGRPNKFLFFPQVSIMKRLEHHNIINLIEVIDDPESDHFYMGTQ